MANVWGTLRSLITQQSYLQGKSKKPILQISLKVFLEVTEAVRVLFTFDSTGKANLSRRSSAAAVINSGLGAFGLTPYHRCICYLD